MLRIGCRDRTGAYDKASLLNVAREVSVLGQEAVTCGGVSILIRRQDGRNIVLGLTRVDHLGAMLQGDFDDLVARQISSDRGVLASLSNDVGLIGLYCAKFSVSRPHL